MQVEDIARLERIAYGAGSTEEERRRAADQLQSLRDAESDRERAAEGADAARADPRADEPAADAASGAPAVATAHEGGRRTALRVGIISGTAALVLGVIAGSQLDRLTGSTPTGDPVTAPTVNPEPLLQADVLAAKPVALDTSAAEVFARPATPADTPEFEGQVGPIDFGAGPVETRLLFVGLDGVEVFAARDGDDLCLLVPTPEPGFNGACTQDGRFPTEGLRVSGLSGTAVSGVDPAPLAVIWYPDGSVRVGLLGDIQEPQ